VHRSSCTPQRVTRSRTELLLGVLDERLDLALLRYIGLDGDGLAGMVGLGDQVDGLLRRGEVHVCDDDVGSLARE